MYIFLNLFLGFVIIVNSIFLSLANFGLLVHRNTTDVYIANLYIPQLAPEPVVNKHLFELPDST